MTDQNQAPERIWATFDEDVSAQTREVYAQDASEGFVDSPTEYVRKDLHDAAIKQRDELAEENVRLTGERDEAVMGHGHEKRLRLEMIQHVEKAEAERDLLKNWQDHHATEVPRLKAQLDQALAASAAREIAMRDRAVECADKMSSGYYGIRDAAKKVGNKKEARDLEAMGLAASFVKGNLQALPLSPDGQQALDDVRADAWDEGFSYRSTGGSRHLNPYRKG